MNGLDVSTGVGINDNAVVGSDLLGSGLAAADDAAADSSAGDVNTGDVGILAVPEASSLVLLGVGLLGLLAMRQIEGTPRRRNL